MTLGEHLRKHRMDLGLYQRQVAEILGANPWTYLLWEHDRTRPTPRFVPAILRFLGYDPFPKGQTMGERLRTAGEPGAFPTTPWPASSGSTRRPS